MLLFLHSLPYVFTFFEEKKKIPFWRIGDFLFFRKTLPFFSFPIPLFSYVTFLTSQKSFCFQSWEQNWSLFQRFETLFNTENFWWSWNWQVFIFLNQNLMCNYARKFRCLHFSNFFFTLSYVSSSKLMPNLKSNKVNWHNVWNSRKKKILFWNKIEKRIFVCFCFFKHNYLFDKRALIFFFKEYVAFKTLL